MFSLQKLLLLLDFLRSYIRQTERVVRQLVSSLTFNVDFQTNRNRSNYHIRARLSQSIHSCSLFFPFAVEYRSAILFYARLGGDGDGWMSQQLSRHCVSCLKVILFSFHSFVHFFLSLHFSLVCSFAMCHSSTCSGKTTIHYRQLILLEQIVKESRL